jgi:hypothetical protein
MSYGRFRSCLVASTGRDDTDKETGRAQDAGTGPTVKFCFREDDGVEIAISVYLPRDLKANERVPVLMRTRRYWREPQESWMLKMPLGLHLVHSHLLMDPQVKYFNERRLA